MPHSKGVTPETSDERASSSRNPNDNNGENPPMAAGRRDENSISFRHFLQPHSDVVPTTTRHNRSSRGVDMGDGASSSVTLPDFVQDHLVLESVASASGGAGSNLEAQNLHAHHPSGSALDNMSVLNTFPDFTTSQRNQSCMSKRNRRHQENVPNNGEGAASTSHGPVALPDFLSDGPMLCSNNITDSGHNNNASSTSSPSNASAAGASASSSLHRVDNTNRDSDPTSSQQLERLRRELTEKSRRLSQLENDIIISRNEASMFEMAYHTCQQSLEAATRRALAAEAQVAKLKSDLAFFKDHYTDKPNRKRSDNCNAAVLSFPGQNPGSSTRNVPNSVNIDSSRVMEIARSSEILVGQLLEQLDELKYVAASDLKGEECRQNSSSSKDKGKTKDGLKPSKQ